MRSKAPGDKRVPLNLTIHPDLKARVEEVAAAQYMSVSQWITVAINQALAAEQPRLTPDEEVKKMISQSIEKFFEEREREEKRQQLADDLFSKD